MMNISVMISLVSIWCPQNDDEDMKYMYNAYLHKLVTCFLSHPSARDKVRWIIFLISGGTWRGKIDGQLQMSDDELQ